MEKLPRSIRKYIRREKSRIRRETLDNEKQKEQIKALYLRFGVNLKKPENKN